MNHFLPHYSEKVEERYLVEMPSIEPPSQHDQKYNTVQKWEDNWSADNHEYRKYLSQLKKYPASWLTSEMKEPMKLGVHFEFDCGQREDICIESKCESIENCKWKQVIAVPLSPSKEVVEDLWEEVESYIVTFTGANKMETVKLCEMLKKQFTITPK